MASAKKSRSALRIERREDVAIVLMDVPRESMNTLKSDFATEFAEAFEYIRQDTELKAVVFGSAKKDCFIAGANIDMLDAAETAEAARELSRTGQQALDALEAFPKPIVAAIDGVCLGGGLEVALACHSRIASTSKKTKFGLPECQLGLLPGAGGTQRLPELIGAQAALDLMLTGKQVNARKAKSLGIVDETVPPSILIDVAVERARELSRKPREKQSIVDTLKDTLTDTDALTEIALTSNPLGRYVLFDQASKALNKKTRGNYPAQERILEVVKTGLAKGRRAGLEAEAKAFGELCMSPESKALRGIYFATQELKRDTGVDNKDVKAREFTQVGMLGAGLMGAGIAYVTAALADTPVRLKDRDADGVLRGLKYARKILDKRVSRRKLSKADADKIMSSIFGATNFEGFESCDVVIEAVFEDLELKQRLLKEVEENGKKDVIFASNTSSLPITKIAEASAHPETVIGMHYFSPVEKMPLLEIITTDKTADWVTATCVALGKAQKKTVIVVNDGPGFYTTRILAPLMNEAAHLVAEGAPIEEIDRAMLDFGFPVGPIKLTDEVGIDVGAKVGKVLVKAFGDRLLAPEGIEKLVADDRMGRKNKRGFYLYEGNKKNEVDPTVYGVLGVNPKKGAVSPEDIAWRCTLQMINEAARCFEEGILRTARDGDIGAIFGLGFPPFRGGPFSMVDAEGAAAIVDKMRKYEASFGARFTPAEILVELAESGKTFRGKNAVKPTKR